MIVTDKAKLRRIINSAKASGKSVLIKKGVFDIIHPGHIFAIQMFKRYADIVVILTQSDAYTKMTKGRSRPINNQKQRTLVIDGIKGVDYTFPAKCNSRNDYVKLLNYLKPTVVAITSTDSKKTKDYSSPFWTLKGFPDKKKPGFSTTEIINRVLEKCG